MLSCFYLMASFLAPLLLLSLLVKNIESRKIIKSWNAGIYQEIYESDSETRKGFKILYNDLVKWCLDYGAKFNKFTLQFHSDNNRYMVATDDIEENEVVMQIPFDIVLHAKNEEIRELRTQLKGLKLHASKNDVVAPVLWLLRYNKYGAESSYGPFINSLPSDISNIPMFYKDGKANDLYRSSYFLKAHEDSTFNARKDDYNTLVEANLLQDGETLDDFAHSFSLFESRDFSVKYKKNKDISVLVPMADLFNFDFRENSIVWNYDSVSDAFVLFAVKKIKKGQEIFVDYGTKPNYELLNGYGFTVANNPFRYNFTLYLHYIKICFDGITDLNKALTPLRMYLYDILYENNSEDMNEEYDIFDKKPEDKESKREGYKANYSEMISIDLEIICLKGLVTIIERVSKDYISTLEEDRKLLKKSTSFDVKNVLRVLIEEKETMGHYKEMALTMLKVLKSKKHIVVQLYNLAKEKAYEKYLTDSGLLLRLLFWEKELKAKKDIVFKNLNAEDTNEKKKEEAKEESKVEEVKGTLSHKGEDDKEDEEEEDDD